jgi:acyl-CoA synthetase (AMP-forming)/AMP-acid ligase II
VRRRAGDTDASDTGGEVQRFDSIAATGGGVCAVRSGGGGRVLVCSDVRLAFASPGTPGLPALGCAVLYSNAMSFRTVLDLPNFACLHDYVAHWSKAKPMAEAMVHDGRRVNYGELAHHVERFAAALQAMGVKKGDRIAMLSSPRPEFFVCLLAAASVGAIWVGLHPRYKIGEFRHVLAETQPKLVFAFGAIDGRDYAREMAALAEEFPGIAAFIAFDRGWHGAIPSARFMASQRPHDGMKRIEAHDPAVIIFTSGSTGAPKGAVLSHHSLIHGALIQASRWPARAPGGARVLNNMPVNHIAGIGMLSMFTLVQGGTLVFQDRFEAGEILRLIESERITLWLQSSAMFHFAVSLPAFAATDFSSLETIVWAGAPMPRDLVNKLATTGARLATAFGMTELGTYVTYSDAEASHDALAASIGKPEPRYALRLARSDGTPVEAGEKGEIQARGDWLFQGYFNAPERTREAFTGDGWFRTGDVAMIRPDGNWQIEGRMKEMYKSGGFNIYPREIEIVLEAHPNIAMAAVLGVPDRVYHEVGHAFVQPEPEAAVSPEEAREWFRERLANYKVPKRFTIMAELPRLANGKLDKMGLRRGLEDGSMT